MGRRTKVGLATLALAAAAWWFWPRGTEAPAPQAEPSNDSRNDILAERRAAREALPSAPEPVSVSGRVIDAESERPIPGALVSLTEHSFDFGSGARPGQSVSLLRALTDDDGRFTIDGVPPGIYTAAASAKTFVPRKRTGIGVRPVVGASDIELRLRTGGHELSGVVSDIGGGPVANAVVRAFPLSKGDWFNLAWSGLATLADGEGRYSITLGNGTYGVVADHPDYRPAFRTTAIRDAPNVEDFALTPGGVVFGQVVGRASGEPVAGAMVVAFGGQQNVPASVQLSGFGLDSVTSDSDGRFTMRGLPSGTVELRATARGYSTRQPTSIELGIGEQRTDVTVRVDEAFTIAGFAVAAGRPDQPVAGAIIGAYNISPGALLLSVRPTADDGYFEILGVPPGSYSLGAGEQRMVPNLMAETVEIVDADVDDVVVELAAGATVRGRVVPPRPASVSIKIDPNSVSLLTVPLVAGRALASARTDDDGTFELVGVPPGAIEVSAVGDDGSAGEAEATIGSDDVDGVVIQLRDRPTLSGTVVDEAGAAVADVQVVAIPETNSDRMSVFSAMSMMGAPTDEAGQFSVLGVEPGSVRVSVRDQLGPLQWAGAAAAQGGDGESGGADVPLTIDVPPTGKSGLRLVVEGRTGSIRGRVVAAGGGPAVDAWVRAQYGGARLAEPGARRFASRRPEKPVLTDDEGRFEITGLRDGSYRLEAESARGGARGEAKDVQTGASATIRLQSLAALEGVVTYKGKPVENYALTARGPTRKRATVFDPEGRYRLERLESGSYSVAITATEGSVTGEVEVTSPDDARLDLAIVPWSSVEGTVVNAATGEPMPGLAVLAFTNGPSDYTELAKSVLGGSDGPKTDANGYFRVNKLAAGKGQAVVLDGEAAGFQVIARAEFELAQGEVRDLGELRGAQPRAVPEDKRGTLGVRFAAATWANRPGPDGTKLEEPGPAPDGIDAAAEYLWAAEVDDGGPAESAGLRTGDRVASVVVEGVAVPVSPDVWPAGLAKDWLAPRNLEAGSAVEIVAVRDGQDLPMVITARPVASSATD